jgi:hypothetical protein
LGCSLFAQLIINYFVKDIFFILYNDKENNIPPLEEISKILNSRTRSDQGQMDQAEDNDIDIDIDKDKRRKSTNSTKHQ